jgi:hypothetical protein
MNELNGEAVEKGGGRPDVAMNRTSRVPAAKSFTAIKILLGALVPQSKSKRLPHIPQVVHFFLLVQDAEAAVQEGKLVLCRLNRPWPGTTRTHDSSQPTGLPPLADVWSRWSISHINSFAAVHHAVTIVPPAAIKARVSIPSCRWV